MDKYLRQGAVLIDSYHRIRVEQQAAQARLRNVRNLLSEKELQDLEEIIYYPYDDIIDNMENEIGYLCNNNIPVYRDFMINVKGLSIYDALQLLVQTKDVEKFPNVSSFWKYCGFAPVKYCSSCGKRWFPNKPEARNWFFSHVVSKRDFISPNGKPRYPFCTCGSKDTYTSAEIRIRGMMPDYNDKVKRLLLSIGTKLMTADGIYRDLFFEYQDLEYKKDSTLSDTHIMSRAKRKMIKVFLYHLYDAWREAEGLPKAAPYMDLPEFQEA